MHRITLGLRSCGGFWFSADHFRRPRAGWRWRFHFNKRRAGTLRGFDRARETLCIGDLAAPGGEPALESRETELIAFGELPLREIRVETGQNPKV